ncbi:hypothetical protein L3Q82_025810, partial [Scortum barcoo]
LAEKYGDVYSLRMGQSWMVVLNRFEILKEALVNQGDILLDRPSLPLQMEVTHGLGKPFNPHHLLNNVVSNIICSLVFGHRFEYSDEKFMELMRWFDQCLEIEGSIWGQLYNSFPLLMRHLPGPHQTFKHIIDDTKDFIREELKEHKQTWDPSDRRDYIDCYLNEIQMNKGQDDSTFDEENLVMCVLDLFVAGTETTSTTLRWAFLYMAKYPEIQAKVQAEIDRVIGQSRQPTMEDRGNMPYTDAVIHEVQRIGNIVPLSLPHVTNRDIQLRGYTVPKGITVIPNLTSVLFDKNEWETPNTFNPGHFLNEEGKFVKRAAFIPFSAGKRLCLGENLARMELFLFFTSFMQHFTFSMPAGVKPVMDYRFGVTLAPHEYEISVFILTADYIKNRRAANFPPGPRAWPIVGNIFTVDHNRTHESMTWLAGKYGDVYSLQMGQAWVVVLNGFKVLKEALVNQGDSLLDCPKFPMQMDRAHGLGVVFSSGNIWKQLRRFALSTFKYLGSGKRSPWKNLHTAQKTSIAMKEKGVWVLYMARYPEIQGSSTVVTSLTSVLFDKNEWETPNTFNRGHFLNEEGKFVKRAALIPFSAGKRLCLGESLARMELFLFFTSCMQHFTFSMPAGVKPVMDYRFGVTLAPHEYEISVFTLTADYIKNRRPANFPPGPRAWPIVGNIFTVDHKRTHESMTQLAEKYGDVYSMRMGQLWMVVLNGFEVLNEALLNQGDSLSDRPDLPVQQDIYHGRGVIFSNGYIWKQQRRFALSTLRYFGFGKKSLESIILEEFTHCAKYFNGCKAKPFNPHLIINNTVSNIICCLVFGHRFEYSDQEFVKLMRWFDKGLEIEGSIWAQNNGQNDNTFEEENLVICVLDLFVAGSETTSTTLRWAFLYMAKYPEIQGKSTNRANEVSDESLFFLLSRVQTEKVQAEIDSVIGQSRQPTMEDRANLPYTNAVIHEIQRMGNIVPLSLPHITNRDIQLGGYTVPKGIIVIPNLTSVLFDKKEWETPKTFNPGHFLNKEGKFFKRAAFIPFSAGKRLCLGESLAKMELFLFFTSFMQHFTISMAEGVKPVLDFRFGVTLAPQEYEICAIPR